MRLFFAGGPIGDEVMLGSSPIPGMRPPIDGPAIEREEVAGPEARRLLRAPVGVDVSGFNEGSALAS